MAPDGIVNMEEEQQEQFARIERAIGTETLAYFCCCVVFDVPYLLNAVPTGNPENKWIEYRKRVKRISKKGTMGFKDGVTDALKVFGDGVPPEDVTKLVQQERKATRGIAGVQPSAEQYDAWGLSSAGNTLTKKDCDRLDYFYSTLTARLNSAGGVDNQQELILRKVASLYWDEERLRAEGEYGEAQKCVKMALDLLSSEQLQKKDAKPVEDVRIDSIIDALEKWGAVENGKILSFPELTEFLLKELGRLGGKPAHEYTQTLDAADYELLFIQNCMAQNEDLPRWMSLPDNMRFSEEVANEFATEQSDDEKRAYEGIGIVKTRPKKNANKKRR